jgi:hypothetical protein
MSWRSINSQHCFFRFTDCLVRSALSTASTAWFNPHSLPVNAGLQRWQLNQVLADSQASYVAVHSEAVNQCRSAILLL